MLRLLLAMLATLLVTQAAIIATSVYLHRGLAHRALKLHPFADWIFRCILWISTGQNRREWVAVHRKHHAFTDKEGDPHSPLMYGFWKIQLWNVYYYVREARNPETIARWAKDIKDDMWDRVLFNWGTVGGVVGVSDGHAALRPDLGLRGGADSLRPVRVRAGAGHQRARALVGAAELPRQQRDQHPRCSPGSRAARACTTTTTRTRRAPSSAWAASSSIPPGSSSRSSSRSGSSLSSATG